MRAVRKASGPQRAAVLSEVPREVQVWPSAEKLHRTLRGLPGIELAGRQEEGVMITRPRRLPAGVWDTLPSDGKGCPEKDLKGGVAAAVFVVLKFSRK